MWICVCDFRRFDAVVLRGESPTLEMLSDWGTTNCTVGDLLDILIRHKLFAAVTVLLPDYKTDKGTEHHCFDTRGTHLTFILLESRSTDATLQCKASIAPALLQGSACPEVTKPVENITRPIAEPEENSESLNTWNSSEGLKITAPRTRSLYTLTEIFFLLCRVLQVHSRRADGHHRKLGWASGVWGGVSTGSRWFWCGVQRAHG